MKNEMVNELIGVMRERIPKGSNLANSLMEILCMGKEAIYRRLRGEVAFTFEEVSLISQHLGISLDKIVGRRMLNDTMFDLNLLHTGDPIESYYEILVRYAKLFDLLRDDPTASVATASNLIPFTFYSPYECLSKFRLGRWIYHHGKMKPPASLSDLQVPDKVPQMHWKLSASIRQLSHTSFIWDYNIFRSIVKEIRYFAGLDLLSAEDVRNMKKELGLLLSELEAVTTTGEFSKGHSLAVYLSDINFEATYTYVEKGDFQACLFRVYSINSMDSQNPRMCNIQKNWIQSLKRHSALISQSSEIQRRQFFNEQREIVESLQEA